MLCVLCMHVCIVPVCAHVRAFAHAGTLAWRTCACATLRFTHRVQLITATATDVHCCLCARLRARTCVCVWLRVDARKGKREAERKRDGVRDGGEVGRRSRLCAQAGTHEPKGEDGT